MSFDFHYYKTVKISAYSCSLSPSMRDSFREFARLYLQERKPVAKKDIPLSKTDYTNWQKLRFAGIITQEQKGYWILTPHGEEFYYGRATILSPWGWMEGKILPPEHEAWKTYQGKRHEVRIDDELSKRIKRTPGYQKEKRGDTLLGDEVMEKIQSGKQKAFEHTVPKMVQQELNMQQTVTE